MNDPIDDSQLYRGDKNVPKENAEFVWTKAMVQEIEKCRKDIIYFAQNHFTIVNLDRGKEKIELYVKQKQILRSMMNNNRVIVCSCRQAGKCLKDNTLQKIRNKKTGEIEEITIKEFYDRFPDQK